MLKSKLLCSCALLVLACLLAVPVGAANTPLSQDDVTLLLIGGATPQKMVDLIDQRGITFGLTPEVEKKFRTAGADNTIIEALKKAGEHRVADAVASGNSSPAQTSSSAGGPADNAAHPSSVQQKINDTMAGLAGHPAAQEQDQKKEEDYPLAPDFSLRDLYGRTFSLADYKGKVVVLDFWATWCAPCRHEIPDFVQFQARYRREGLQMLGVSVDNSSGRVKTFYEQYGMNYPVAMASGKVRSAYGGIYKVPTTLVIDRAGRVRSKIEGAPVDLSGFEQEVKLLLAPPQQASPQTEIAAANTPIAPSIASSDRRAETSAAPSADPARSAAGAPPAAKVSPARASAPDLSDPSPDRVQQIIQAFAAKEETFKRARDNYTFHQINKVEELDADNNVTGEYEQDWDILYDDNGVRIERVTYAPTDSLKQLMITEEDLDSMRNIQPFVLTTDELPEYDIKYLGHVKVDQLTAYVFSIRPRELKKGKVYFQGVVWVDDQDLQIVKSEGKTVPEVRAKHGQFNLFPRFTTWRQQIDGKFWFPTFTMADDTLYFPNGPVHMREIIKYGDYKQFKSTVKTKIVVALPNGQTQDVQAAPDKNSKP